MSRKLFQASLWSGAAAGMAFFGCGRSAEASVILSFHPTGGTPAAITTTQGGSFDASLYLISKNDATSSGTATITSGITDVKFDMSSQGSKFTLVSRDMTSSEYPVVNPAALVAASLPYPNLMGFSSPDDAMTLFPTDVPVGNHLVAKFHFTVDSTTPLGNYTLFSIDPSGDGYIGGLGVFGATHPFDSLGSVVIQVLAPEPSSIGIAVAGLLLGAASRRGRR